ncbi:hypothetical protein [Romboutsia sp. 1001216sp1]|nr:hypothetical protein [Romboutsia sp. 1001216sp1]MDB8806296.1 hypothetical protein [Romboutsia sp. 1001216sp1]MDB8817690.1 hypothetical protein [Romboutsia sp. 1001216sp1]
MILIESEWKNLTELMNLIFIGVQHISKADTKKGEEMKVIVTLNI